MKKDKKYEVRITKWINGILTTVEKKFQNFKEAKDFSEEQEDAKVKIYGAEGEIIHSKFKEKKDKYEGGHGGHENHGGHGGGKDDDDKDDDKDDDHYS